MILPEAAAGNSLNFLKAILVVLAGTNG